jgi:hypothetical protein
MRYGTETRLTPEEVLDRARAFFGPGGEVGLPETAAEQGTVTFAAEIGGVSVSATSMDRRTDVTILSREFDYWAERFIRELP